MAKATHRVGFRHFTYGEWREPNSLVDASKDPNLHCLEAGGYLRRLRPEEQVELPQAAPTEPDRIEPPPPATATTDASPTEAPPAAGPAPVVAPAPAPAPPPTGATRRRKRKKAGR
jgi:hypothetical protein